MIGEMPIAALRSAIMLRTRGNVVELLSRCLNRDLAALRIALENLLIALSLPAASMPEDQQRDQRSCA